MLRRRSLNPKSLLRGRTSGLYKAFFENVKMMAPINVDLLRFIITDTHTQYEKQAQKPCRSEFRRTFVETYARGVIFSYIGHNLPRPIGNTYMSYVI